MQAGARQDGEPRPGFGGEGLGEREGERDTVGPRSAGARSDDHDGTLVRLRRPDRLADREQRIPVTDEVGLLERSELDDRDLQGPVVHSGPGAAPAKQEHQPATHQTTEHDPGTDVEGEDG